MSDHISLYASMEVSRIKKKVKKKVLFETDTNGNLFVPNICTLQHSQPLDTQKSVHICQNLVISFPVTFHMTVHYSNHFHAISSMLCPLTVSVQMGKTPTLNLYSNINMLVTKGRLTCVRSVLIVAGMRSGWNIQRLISSGLLSPARSQFSKVPRPARTARPAGDWGPKHRHICGRIFTFKP